MRLAAQAKMGYYPTPPSVVPLIKDFLIRSGKGNIKLLDQFADNGSLKDMWAAFRRKEIQVDCNVAVSRPVEVKADKLTDKVERMSVEAEQIGDKVLKVSFTEYVGRRKKTTRIEVKKSELNKMMKKKDGPMSVQLRLF